MHIKIFIVDLIEWFLNYIVAHIPCWYVRKFFYKLFGMKIGKKSRILMGLYVRKPWRIVIGSGSIINEKCFLDGRGYIKIGNNVSISIYSKILTATHLSKSDTFEYVEYPVIIEDNVWMGINSIILPGSTLYDNSILAAGSVLIKQKVINERSLIYSGIPAIKIGQRNNDPNYKMWESIMYLK